MKTIQESVIMTLGYGSGEIIQICSVVRKPSKSPKFGPLVLAALNLKSSKPAVLYENHPRVRNVDPWFWRRQNLLKLINYSYGYKPIGVPHFGQVHVS